MDDFDKFFKKHKKEIYYYAKKNTKYNKDGYAVIPKGDEWSLSGYASLSEDTSLMYGACPTLKRKIAYGKSIIKN